MRWFFHSRWALNMLEVFRRLLSLAWSARTTHIRSSKTAGQEAQQPLTCCLTLVKRSPYLRSLSRQAHATRLFGKCTAIPTKPICSQLKLLSTLSPALASALRTLCPTSRAVIRSLALSGFTLRGLQIRIRRNRAVIFRSLSTLLMHVVPQV